MDTTNTSTGSYIVYASLIVSALAHFGWIITSNDVIAIIGGIVAFGANIYQHYKTKQVTAQAIGAGIQGIK